MKKSNIILLIVSGGIFLVGLGIFAVGLNMADWNWVKLDDTQLVSQQYVATSQEIDSLDGIEITSNVNIKLQYGEGLTVDYWGNPDISNKIAFVKQGILTIDVNYSKSWAIWGNPFEGIKVANAEIVVTIPQSVELNMSIKTTNCRLTVDQLRAKKISLSSKDAKVSLNNIDADDMSISVKDAKAELNNIDVDNMSIDIKDANMQLNLVGKHSDYNIAVVVKDGKSNISSQYSPIATKNLSATVRNGKLNTQWNA
ncbi:MAG: DUF4097 family beta strand repeat-containing protein [Clostridiales bacterium]|jgi:hypothetical protein|nr:DUF4097 family beta strand repeat-containing protein [Clostridiales bacterium]